MIWLLLISALILAGILIFLGFLLGRSELKYWMNEAIYWRKLANESIDHASYILTRLKEELDK